MSRPFKWFLKLFGLVILIGILLPVFSPRLIPPSIRGVRADAKSLSLAIMLYYNEYGLFPLQRQPGHDHEYEGDYNALISVLRGNPESTDHNPRNIVFINIPERSVSETGAFVDPWGSPYHVVANSGLRPRRYDRQTST